MTQRRGIDLSWAEQVLHCGRDVLGSANSRQCVVRPENTVHVAVMQRKLHNERAILFLETKYSLGVTSSPTLNCTPQRVERPTGGDCCLFFAELRGRRQKT